MDNDPMVMAHARALLTSAPEGRTAYLEADLREPETILTHRDLLATLDLSRPIGLMLVAVLHFIPGPGAAAPIVARLLDALPTGSYLVATNATKDFLPEPVAAVYHRMLATGQTDIWPRDRAEVAALLRDLDIVEPGVVPVNEWRAESEEASRPASADVSVYGAVARLP